MADPGDVAAEQAAVAEAAAVVTPDPDALADRCAGRVVTRLAGLLTQEALGDGQDPAGPGSTTISRKVLPGFASSRLI